METRTDFMVSIQVGQGTYRAGILLPTHHEAEVEAARQRRQEAGVTHSYVAKSGTVFPTPKVKPYRKSDTEWAVYVAYADGTKIRLARWYNDHREACNRADDLLIQNPALEVVLEAGAPPKPAASSVPVIPPAQRTVPVAILTLALDL